MKLERSDFNWKFLLTNRRYLILSVVCGLVTILVIFYGLIPQFKKVSEIRRDITLEKKELQALRIKASDLDSLPAVEAYQAKDKVDRILPARKPLLELLSGLNTIGVKNKIKFNDFSLSPGKIASASADFLEVGRSGSSAEKNSKDAKGYGVMPIEIAVSGQFSDIQQFFLDVERMSPLVTITSLSLNVRDLGMVQPDDKVGADLTLNSYYFTRTVTASLKDSLPEVGAEEKELIEEIKQYTYPSVAVQKRIKGGGYEDIFGLSQKELELEGQD